MMGSNGMELSRFMRGECGKRSNVYPGIMRFLKRPRGGPKVTPKVTIPSKDAKKGRPSTSSTTSSGSLASSLPAAAMRDKVEAKAVDPTSAKRRSGKLYVARKLFDSV
jgi:hypothetical protein